MQRAMHFPDHRKPPLQLLEPESAAAAAAELGEALLTYKCTCPNGKQEDCICRPFLISGEGPWPGTEGLGWI